MREVLENVPLKEVAKAIGKLSLPDNLSVRVVIETLDKPLSDKASKPKRADDRFLEEIESMPAAEDLPEDLAYQHDHYLYGLSKKAK